MKKQVKKKEVKAKAKKEVKVKDKKEKKVKNEDRPAPKPIYAEPNVVQPVGDVSDELLVEVDTETPQLGEHNAQSESDRHLTDTQKQSLQFHFTAQINEDDLSGTVAEVLSKITSKTQATEDEVRMIITS